MIREGCSMLCPHCGEKTILKKKVLMDGWTKKGEILVCALCGKKIEIPPAPEEKTAAPSNGTEKLLSLFGNDGEDERKVFQLKADETEVRFCKDCRFCVKHPFKLVCAKSDRIVEPMDDCDLFERLENRHG